ncbi:MAG: hypothetical protein NC123_17070, partial [Butyrivibrio sp.]|nr:hypothetical protein [Butyrivibrio sp.]
FRVALLFVCQGTIEAPPHQAITLSDSLLRIAHPFGYVNNFFTFFTFLSRFPFKYKNIAEPI